MSKVKMVLHIEIDENDMGLPINDILDKLKKQDKQQSTLPEDEKKPRKYHCNNLECKKEITKSEVAYCLYEENKPRFKGKVYCLKCQEGY